MHVAPLGQLVKNLITSDQRKIAKTHVDHRLHAGNRSAGNDASLERFGYIGIQNAFGTEFGRQPLFRSEPTAGCHALTQHEHAVIPTHLFDKGLAHCGVIAEQLAAGIVFLFNFHNRGTAR